MPQRYADDEAAGKVYFDFWPGLRDAATTRHPTHELADWKAGMFWMTAYFSAGAWSGILLMVAPRAYGAPARPSAPDGGEEGGAPSHSVELLQAEAPCGGAVRFV